VRRQGAAAGNAGTFNVKKELVRVKKELVEEAESILESRF
jgi:hypothetical protein